MVGGDGTEKWEVEGEGNCGKEGSQRDLFSICEGTSRGSASCDFHLRGSQSRTITRLDKRTCCQYLQPPPRKRTSCAVAVEQTLQFLPGPAPFLSPLYRQYSLRDLAAFPPPQRCQPCLARKDFVIVNKKGFPRQRPRFLRARASMISF
eukprot:764379-Hanusia_phi.AAC.3